MTDSREQTLHRIGLGPLWKLRVQTSVEVAPPTLEPDSEWSVLNSSVMACRQCRLCEQRTQAVLGVGDLRADWLFVGEAPGDEEDARGQPFVGEAGQLLDKMVAAIDLKRGEDVYFTDAVKCRPPEDRKPHADELAACRPHLVRQIELLRPRLIVALGRSAAQALLQREVKISAERGRVHDVQGIPLVITYHPAYLLRNVAEKAKSWEDLRFMRQTMRGLKPA